MSSDDLATPKPQLSVSQEMLDELFRRLGLRSEFEDLLIQQIRQLATEGRLRNPTRLATCLRFDPSAKT